MRYTFAIKASIDTEHAKEIKAEIGGYLASLGFKMFTMDVEEEKK